MQCNASQRNDDKDIIVGTYMLSTVRAAMPIRMPRASWTTRGDATRRGAKTFGAARVRVIRVPIGCRLGMRCERCHLPFATIYSPSAIYIHIQRNGERGQRPEYDLVLTRETSWRKAMQNAIVDVAHGAQQE